MKLRNLCLIAVIFSFSAGAFASGSYVNARSKSFFKKTLVWTNSAHPNQTAFWSGDRDREGYATGQGTLTWFEVRETALTGSNLPVRREMVVNRYTGKMERGKFNGIVVNADADGNTLHAKFANGKKVGDWLTGSGTTSTAVAANQSRQEAVPRAELIEAAATPAPTNEKPEETASPKIANEKIDNGIPLATAEKATKSLASEPPPPAEGPAAAKIKQPAPSQQTDSQRPKTEKQPAATPVQDKYDDSLKELIGPPSGLRGPAQAATSPAPQPAPSVSDVQPRLTQPEVIVLADTEVRTQGYELDDYLRPQAQYDAANGNWSVVYEQKSDANGMSGLVKPLSVSIEDKSKKAEIAPR